MKNTEFVASDSIENKVRTLLKMVQDQKFTGMFRRSATSNDQAVVDELDRLIDGLKKKDQQRQEWIKRQKDRATYLRRNDKPVVTGFDYWKTLEKSGFSPEAIKRIRDEGKLRKTMRGYEPGEYTVVKDESGFSLIKNDDSPRTPEEVADALRTALAEKEVATREDFLKESQQILRRVKGTPCDPDLFYDKPKKAEMKTDCKKDWDEIRANTEMDVTEAIREMNAVGLVLNTAIITGEQTEHTERFAKLVTDLLGRLRAVSSILSNSKNCDIAKRLVKDSDELAEEILHYLMSKKSTKKGGRVIENGVADLFTDDVFTKLVGAPKTAYMADSIEPAKVVEQKADIEVELPPETHPVQPEVIQPGQAVDWDYYIDTLTSLKEKLNEIGTPAAVSFVTSIGVYLNTIKWKKEQPGLVVGCDRIIKDAQFFLKTKTNAYRVAQGKSPLFKNGARNLHDITQSNKERQAKLNKEMDEARSIFNKEFVTSGHLEKNYAKRGAGGLYNSDVRYPSDVEIMMAKKVKDLVPKKTFWDIISSKDELTKFATKVVNKIKEKIYGKKIRDIQTDLLIKRFYEEEEESLSKGGLKY